MTKIPKQREPFRQQLVDLLLNVEVPTETAIEVAEEVVKKSTIETPMETIRSMILDSLRQRDDPAVEKRAKRFERTKLFLIEARRSEIIGPGEEIYDESALDELIDSDEITTAELYFMWGREGHSWLRERKHFDAKSTELSSEEYYDD